jgi:O-antigen ligase/polysaccharide polymerase Wzy-like membrane protein
VTEIPRKPSPSALELVVAAHAAIFIIGVSWAFGGNADWVRTPISLWGSLGILLSVCIIAGRGSRARIGAGTLSWALPVVALNGLVLASCLRPGFRDLVYGKEVFLMPLWVPWWTPSAARPELALRSLWLFDGIYFSCLNIALAVRRRHVIRIILATAVGNALALSIFGTVQKLVGSTGIYFGSVKSPQDYFFASFVYDNHWGAFIILMMGACIGLVLRYARGIKGDGFFHGPAMAGIVAAALIGVTVPLSGARACTLLLGAMGILALAKGAPTVSRSLRMSGVAPAGAYAGIALAVILASWGAWTIAGDVVNSRVSKAREQIAAAWAKGGLGARSILYHDTWRMARARPLFGWGMGSYPSVFALYNTQVPTGDRIPVVYHDAHSDWLQSVSEVGFLGTVLLGATAAIPAWSVRRRRGSPIAYFPLAGCALVAAYAWVEFPFGNVAVVLAWWLCFFCSIQYIRLTGPPDAPPSQ